jgi:hypothetical protein
MADCGQHCGHPDTHGNRCTLRPHARGAHVFGPYPCVTGHAIRYVDAQTAAMYPVCGLAGVLTEAEITALLARPE